MVIAFSFLSLLNDDYKNAIKKFNSLDKDNWLHYDVMDGHFVSNCTFDQDLVKEINTYNHLFSDVHLMIENPESVVKEYAKVQVDQLTFHYEAVSKDKINDIISLIKSQNIKVGMSVKPNTDICLLDEYLPYLDYILVMSVEPGKGGQKFMEKSLDHIKYLKNKQDDYHYLIGVDGGINLDTAKLVKQAGADVIVVGTYLANNLNIETINHLK